MSELAHKERQFQDIIDEMTPEQRELMDLIIGAAVEDEVIDDDDVVEQALALPEEQRQLIDFLIGGILSKAESEELAQANLRVDNFLEHFGVKGMKWGVRNVDRGVGGGSSKSQQKPAKPAALQGVASTVKLSGSTRNTADERKAARKEVRKGTASAETAHVAALKSTGHRVANAFLGDKTYWKAIAVTAGVAGAVALSPAVLPASVLGTVGAAFTGASASSAVTAAAGSTAITTSAYLGMQVSATALQITNLVRAVRGNTRIDDSYARLGANVASSYKKGMDRSAKVLRKDGGLSGRKVKRAMRQSEDFMSGYAAVSLGEMAHALEAGSGSSAKKDKGDGKGKGGGKGDFDESKVKRDGGGKFSKIAAKRPEDDARDAARDNAWLDTIDTNPKLAKQVWDSPGLEERMMSKIREVEKQAGEKLTSNSRTPAVLAARKEYTKYVVTEVNKVLDKAPIAVAPSGTQRVQLKAVPGGFEYHLVAISAKHGDTEDGFQHTLTLEDILKLLKQSGSTSGPEED